MEITVVELLVPEAPSTLAQASLLVLRLFLGIAFIRHGWPKLRNLKTWATAMNTPQWLCFLSAASMWGAGIALIPGLLTPLAALAILVSMAYATVIEIKAGFPGSRQIPTRFQRATTWAPWESVSRRAGRRPPCTW